jgi:hypothetical protein
MKKGFMLALCLFPVLIMSAQNTTQRIVDKVPAYHPRIILNEKRVKKIQNQLESDKDMQKIMSALRVQGEFILSQPPVAHKLSGNKRFRLLHVSRLVFSRILTLGMLFQISKEDKWRDRAVAELKTVCAFPNWHPDHFLDTAEMAAAVAIGYDWLYPALSQEERSIIRKGLIKHGLKAGLQHQKSWWVKGENNWNQVCHSGMVLTALALAQDEPEGAEQLLQNSKLNFKYGLKAYSPAGVYPEGPNYWSYGTSYSILMASALESTIGNDWGIMTMPGFQKSCPQADW